MASANPVVTILVVDDDATTLGATALLLREAGYQVAESGTGGECLRLVRELQPALVLLDLVLPDLTGLDVIRQVRADPNLASVSMVISTAFQTAPEQQVAGLDAGANGYIARPITDSELLARVRSQLRQRDLAEKLRASEALLRDSLREIRDLTAALDEHAIVAITDPRGIIIFVNDKFCAISRYTREELIGQDHRIINSGFHPKEFIRHLWTTIAGGNVWHGEIKNKAKDGSFYWVDTTIVPFLNADGKPREYVAIRADITERKLAEAAMKESEELFSNAFRLSPDGLLISRLSDRSIVRANAALCELGGSTPEEVIGRSIQEYANWLTDGERMSFTRTLEEQGECLDYSTRLRMADGRILDCVISSRLITSNGEPCVLSVVRDVTETKRTKKALGASELRYRQLFESAKDGIMILDAETGMIVEVNPFLISLLGYPRQRFLGKPVWELGFFNDLLADEIQFSKLRESEYLRYENLPLKTSDGTLIAVEFISSVYMVEDTKVIQCNVRDVTERQKSEETLRLLSSVVEQSSESILITDSDLDLPGPRILFVNPAFTKMTGYTAEEVLGKTPRILQGPRTDKAVLRRLRENLDRGEAFEGEAINYRKDRTEFYLEWRIAPIQDGDGKISHYVALQRDVSERKATAEKVLQLNAELEQRVTERTAQLEAANRELEAFSYSVSHDLRAPLRAVDGFSQAVVEDFGPLLPEIGKTQLDTIRRAAQRMGSLIDDLLAFSRLGRTPLDKHQIDTQSLVQGVLKDLEDDRAGRQVILRIGELPACSCDPSLLRQVWLNLLSNAFKYTRRRETAIVELGCETTPEGNVYFLRDNGTGFDMRYADKLFGVFQRLHRAEDYEGTGVGLAIVQRIIHRHGGRIWAEAVLDEGATFYFTLGTESKP